MSSGERPIGTAKGKQPNAEALCPPPPPPLPNPNGASGHRQFFLVGAALRHIRGAPPPPPCDVQSPGGRHDPAL